ncbi:metallophosphoesterase [Promineifilum sp.]|uniref:metallophosphoesterase family protein n=1 Tax=Promineifilum sp. TaxID=2664178 RepID=UPI0035B3219E
MRYVILTDIHANELALRAIMAEVDPLLSQGEALALWFLGDIIGYGPDPIPCLEWLREQPPDLPRQWVPGNHDEWFIHQAEDGMNGDTLDSLRRHGEALARPEHAGLSAWFRRELDAVLTDNARTLLRADFDGGRTAIGVHAALEPSIRRTHYLKPWIPSLLRNEFPALRDAVGEERAAVMFCGHNHFPMWAEWAEAREGNVRLRSIRYGRPAPLGGGLTLVNPGSAGQPRDGDTRAAYALFDPAAWTIEFRRVAYDCQQAARRLRAHNYGERLALQLEDGYSDDTPYYLKIYQRPEWDLRAVERVGGEA